MNETGLCRFIEPLVQIGHSCGGVEFQCFEVKAVLVAERDEQNKRHLVSGRSNGAV